MQPQLVLEMALGRWLARSGLLAAAALLQTAAALSPPVLDALWPSGGSIAGGTYVIFKGSGFGRGGESGFTKAYINGKECRQNQGIALDR